jgi:hypothetical protein
MWNSHILWKDTQARETLCSVVCGETKSITLIIGEGFDPRMTDCLKLIRAFPLVALEVYCLQIGRAKSEGIETLQGRVDANVVKVREVLGVDQRLTFIDTRFEDDDRNSTAPASSDKAIEFARGLDISGSSSVVVDISALTQGLYFPILEVFISQRREEFDERGVSLYVFVSENAELDGKISALELQEDAYLVPPFRSALTGTDDLRPIIWFPVLGEGEKEQIDRIQKLLPARVELEICPVLPMPSAEPRRADDLIREYEYILQDTWSVDSRSFIYSAEQNPFHLFSQLTRAADRYREALEPIGGCRAVISSHSSKLLSLGALLAASELNRRDFDIGLANVDATRYELQLEVIDQSHSTYFLVPLLGEVYNV